MTLPRIRILALGGTIATQPDASGAMQMGLGADDLVAAVPALASLADIGAETVSRVGRSMRWRRRSPRSMPTASSSRRAPTRWKRRPSCSICCSTATSR